MSEDYYRKAFHKMLGEVRITLECHLMQRTNPDPTSIFVEHEGEIKEVTKSLVTIGKDEP